MRVPIAPLLTLALIGAAPAGCSSLAGYSSTDSTDARIPAPDSDGPIDATRDADGDLGAADTTLDSDGSSTDGPKCGSSAMCANSQACVAGQCVSWWNRAWRYRQRIVLTNRASITRSPGTLSRGTTVGIVLDTQALGSKLDSACSDLRIVHQPAGAPPTQLAHYVDVPDGLKCATSPATEVYLSLQADLLPDAPNGEYFVYYGNAGALDAATVAAFSASSGAKATLACPFRGTVTCAGATPDVAQWSTLRYPGGSAVELDGVNAEIKIPIKDANNVVPATGQGTIALSLMLPAPPMGASMGLVSFAASGTPYLSIDNDTLVLRVAGKNVFASGITLDADKWHRVALRWNGTTLDVFFDRIRVITTQWTGDLLGADDSLLVGNNADGRFRGFIDEIRISSAARKLISVSQIESIQAFDIPPDTEALLHFDEGGADVRLSASSVRAFDASGHGRHAGIVNGWYTVGRSPTYDFPAAQWAKTVRQPFGSHGGVYLQAEAVNYVVNPSFEANLDDWVLSATALRTAGGLFGTSVVRVSGPGGITTAIAGREEATVSFYARSSDGSPVTAQVVRPVLRGVVEPADYHYAGNGWWRVSPQQLAASVGSAYGVEVLSGHTVDIDGFDVHFGSRTHIDGSLAAPVYSWKDDCDPASSNTAGTPNASCSVRSGIARRKQGPGLTYKNDATSRLLSEVQGAISLWFRPTFDVTSNGPDATLLQVGRTPPSGPGFELRLHQGKLELSPFNGTGSVSLSTSGITAGQWHHVVATWLGGQASLHLDSTSAQSGQFAPNSVDNVIAVGGGNGWTDPARATIADLRLFSGPLTPAAVNDLYRSSLVTQRYGPEVTAAP